MRPYDKVILLVSVLVSWTVAGMPSAAAGAPGMDIPSMQPRIATLKDKVESLESEYGVRFVYSSDINLERPYIGVRAEAAENAVESDARKQRKMPWNQAVPKALKLPLTGCSGVRESAGRSTAGT